jgi:hypothetical protein
MLLANPSEWSSRDCTVTTRAPSWWQIPHPNFLRRQLLMTPAIPKQRHLRFTAPMSHWVSSERISKSSLPLRKVMWSEIPPGRQDKHLVSGDLEGTANLSRDSQRKQAVSAWSDHLLWNLCSLLSRDFCKQTHWHRHIARVLPQQNFFVNNVNTPVNTLNYMFFSFSNIL